MERLVRPIPVSDADHGFSGILTLELIQLDVSRMRAKPPSGRLVPRRPLDARLVTAVSSGPAPAGLARSRVLDPTHDFISGEVLVSRIPQESLSIS